MVPPPPYPPDRYGHADAFWDAPPPPDVADLDAWARDQAPRWAAELIVTGDSDRARRVELAADLITRTALRHDAIRHALRIRTITGDTAKTPRTIFLTPHDRRMLRDCIATLGQS